jgi:hypothetical protein
MAQPAGTTSTYDLKTRREDYAGVVYTLSADQTPFLSRVSKTDRATDIRTDWNIDVLVAPDSNNAVVDGDEPTYAKAEQPTRVGNVLQISQKALRVSGTADAVKKATPSKTEMGRLRIKRGIEIMRDMEAAIVARNQASVLGADATARRSASLAAWLTTNVSRGVGGVNGGYNTGTGLVAAATDGTQRAFTQALVDATALLTANQGEMPKIAMMAPVQKQTFSTFAGAGTNQIVVPNTAKSRTVVQGVDYYRGNFGQYEIVPNYVMAVSTTPRTRDVFLINPEYVCLAFLRPIMFDDLAKTGDFKNGVVRAEWTLKVKNEAAHAVIADLT